MLFIALEFRRNKSGINAALGIPLRMLNGLKSFRRAEFRDGQSPIAFA
jgi:hypothetical protein